MKLILKLAIVALLANAGYRIGTEYLAHIRFRDAVREVATFRSTDNADLRRRIAQAAEKFDIPQADDDVDILREGVHSGEASGVVPSTFRIIRGLLDRIEDSTTGEILLPELHVEIPADRRRQATDTGAEFHIEADYPWVDGARPMTVGSAEQLLARTWHPTLSVTGVDVARSAV